jgi:hypothetical protein
MGDYYIITHSCYVYRQMLRFMIILINEQTPEKHVLIRPNTVTSYTYK